MGRILGGRYEILEKIGEGGMSIVYKAKCKLLHRFVAIKILKPEFLQDQKFIESFRRESQAAASLTHPNIVNIYDVGLEGKNIHYIVMEYVEGETLSEVIKREGPLSNETVIDIASQIASALSHAHKNHIIHRDVKPHNILISEDGTAKITDFGIAKAMNSTTIVKADAVMGSVHYFSPEQARGGYVDERSDIYSLGIVMYEMATGNVPFDGDNPVSVAMMHINQEMTPPSELNPKLSKSIEKIILKAADKYQTNRFSSADEMNKALNAVDLKNDVLGAGLYNVNNMDNASTRVLDKNFEADVLLAEKAATEDNNLKKNGKTKKKIKLNKNKILGIILGLIAALFLSQGLLLVKDMIFDDEIKVPHLAGIEYEQAVSDLEELGLKGELAESVYSSEFDENEVTSQTPAAGASVKEGFIVRLTISKGGDKNTIPNLISKKYETAVSIIKSYGFALGDVTNEDNSAPEGTVIAQSPESGTKKNQGTEISLVLSTGISTDTIAMPKLVGTLLEKATAAIKEAGLSVGDITFEYSDKYDENIVIKQSEAAGAEVDPETKINISVSKGPDPDKIDEGGVKTVPLVLDYTKSPNEVFNIKINRIQDGKVELVHDMVHYKSNNGESIMIEGEGQATITVYFDDNLVLERTLNFATGKFTD